MREQKICIYCGDPIYDFQDTNPSGNMHKGCWELKKEEEEYKGGVR